MTRPLYIDMPQDAAGNTERLAFSTYNDSRLDLAIRDGGRPVRINAAGAVTHQYGIRQFEGGWLLDDCPINVVMDYPWIAGQIDALRAAGLRPNCPECRPGSRCMNEFDGRTSSSSACPVGFIDGDTGGCVPDISLSPDQAADYAIARAGGRDAIDTAAAAGSAALQQSPPGTTAYGAPTFNVSAAGGSTAGGNGSAPAVDGTASLLEQYWLPITLGLAALLLGGKRR